jgi:septum site-determining protein MinD
MKEILLVTSGKGGVGKSTLSALISLKLSSRKKVLIIDSDLGLNNLDIIFNIKSNQYDILDVVKGRCNLSDAFIKIKENLYLLNLCISLNVAKYPDDLLEAIIEYVKDDFEYIIIDSPAGIEKGFNNALKVANKVVVVLNDELTSYEDARKIKRICSINNIKKFD